MTDSNQQENEKRPVEELTDEELLRELFPPEVVESVEDSPEDSDSS